jgi:protease I
MTIEGKRIPILTESDFEDDGLTMPVKAMKDAGAEISIVGSKEGKTYRGKRKNAKVTTDAAADRINPQDFDAIIIPGGYAPDKMRLHRSMVDFVRKARDGGKLVAAICHGPQLLISARIVNGKRITSWPSVTVDLKNAGAKWVDEEVVKDDNLITSRKPADLPAFNRAIIDTLEKR